jgi:hypothetical protein
MAVPTVTNLDAAAAFSNKGAKAAVFRPRFGQALGLRLLTLRGISIAER